MRGTFTFYWKLILGALFILIAFGLSTYAANVEVSAQLSHETITLGTPVQLEIMVKGARNAQVPHDLKIDGLQTQFAGESVQVQMLNFQVSTSSLYAIDILPLRVGDFVIPELEVKISNKIFRTKPLHLKVIDSKSNSGSSSAQSAIQNFNSINPPASSSYSSNHSGDAQLGKLAFGVLIIPTKKIYVGEVVPVEICYYFHPNLPLQSINSMPTLIGDNFMVQKMSEPQQGQQDVKGVKYMVVSVKSSIRPLKVGELELPSTSIVCQILTQARPEIPAGMLADTFFQHFLDSMPGITRVQRVDVKSEPVTIQVLPLPEENKPASFHGAIGNFSLKTELFSKDPSPGDPVTLRAIISGEGNFGQLIAPKLLSKQGWQTYPPVSKFKALDTIEYSGEKTFEWMLVPKENKTTTPELEFSYFNTNLHKYVTLRGEAQAVHAVALSQVISAPQKNIIPPSAVSSSVSIDSEKFKLEKDLHLQSFRPLISRWEFITTNSLALFGLLTFLGVQLARYYTSSARGAKEILRRSLAAHRKEASISQGKEFYSAAVESLRLRAAISERNRDTKNYSAEEVIDALGLQQEKADLVLEVFSRYEELTYGAHTLALPLSAERRAAILEILKEK